MMPLTVSVPVAGVMLDMKRQAAFRAAKEGRIPTIKLGTLRVPVAKLAELVGPISEDRIAAAIAQVEAA